MVECRSWRCLSPLKMMKHPIEVNRETGTVVVPVFLTGDEVVSLPIQADKIDFIGCAPKEHYNTVAILDPEYSEQHFGVIEIWPAVPASELAEAVSKAVKKE